MITREYKCPNCGIFERKESVKDAPLDRCLDCNEKIMQIYGEINILLFNSPYFYDGSFHRHPQKTSNNPNGVRIKW